VPSTITPRRPVLRRLLLPFTSLLLFLGLALVGPAATAAPSHQATASAAKHGPAKKHHKRHHKRKHHHKRHHAKKHHHKKHAASPAKPAEPAQGTGTESRVERAANIVLQQVGDPYRWGGTGPSSFDCSGLMQYSFGKAGIKIPRTAAAQSGRAHHIARSKLQRGDLLYFTDGGRIYHTAMFLKWSHGKVQMVHAPGTGKRVRIDTPWTNSWFAGSMR